MDVCEVVLGLGLGQVSDVQNGQQMPYQSRCAVSGSRKRFGEARSISDVVQGGRVLCMWASRSNDADILDLVIAVRDERELSAAERRTPFVARSLADRENRA